MKIKIIYKDSEEKKRNPLIIDDIASATYYKEIDSITYRFNGYNEFETIKLDDNVYILKRY